MSLCIDDHSLLLKLVPALALLYEGDVSRPPLMDDVLVCDFADRLADLSCAQLGAIRSFVRRFLAVHESTIALAVQRGLRAKMDGV